MKEQGLKHRDFVDLRDFKSSELQALLRLAEKIKAKEIDVSKCLNGKMLGLLFNAPSTRTRLSFQAGIRHMGGHGEYLDPERMQLINQESFTDTAKVLSKFLDGLIIRMYDLEQYGLARAAIRTIIKESTIPVINALDDKDHPCQVMADLLTLYERYGADYRNKRMVFTWGYSAWQQSPGIPHSMLSATALLGMDAVFVNPEGYELDEEYVEFAKRTAALSGSKLEFSNNLTEATEGADMIYVKSWKSLRIDSKADQVLREKIKDDWRVEQRHMDRANPGALFMNCMPLVRGEQASREVVDGPCSVIYQEAENRLHMQKAIMASIFDSSVL